MSTLHRRHRRRRHHHHPHHRASCIIQCEIDAKCDITNYFLKLKTFRTYKVFRFLTYLLIKITFFLIVVLNVAEAFSFFK